MTESPPSLPPDAPESRAERGASLLRQYGGVAFRTYGIIVAFVILVIVVSIGNPAFLSQGNIFNMLSQWAPAGIMAVGMTYVILTGGFDLSIASGYSLCAVVAAGVGILVDPAYAFLAAIAAGFFVGLLNAVLVVGVNINPFITTVGTGFILGGVTYVVTKNAAFVVPTWPSAISAPAVGTASPSQGCC